MDKRIVLNIIVMMALFAIFGCTGNERVAYDCSKCNATTDCSQCPGGGVGFEPVKINAGLTMMVPPSCTDELCRMTETGGWAKEVGLETQIYSADWAQGPILLLYTEKKAYVFQPTPAKKGDFMKGICTFTNDTKACAIANNEGKNATANTKSCLENRNVSFGAVAFYHADWCPHCAKMKPWVQELEGKGYKFYWIEEQNTTAISVLKDCLSKVIDASAGYPQFACPANGKLQLGEFPSKESMEAFAKECAQAAK